MNNYPLILRIRKKFDKKFKEKVKTDANIFADKFLSIHQLLESGATPEEASKWMKDIRKDWDDYVNRQLLCLEFPFREIWHVESSVLTKEERDFYKKKFEKFAWDFYACSNHITEANILYFSRLYDELIIDEEKNYDEV